MVKIIVVDDEQKEQERIKSVIDPLHFKYEDTIKTMFFKKLEKKLLEEINDLSERKIYILDICLNGKLTGINIALKIRETDWDSEIIFLTNHSNYEQKVYNNVLKTFKFIQKFDNMEERLSQCLNKILKQKYDNKTFNYRNNQIDLRIYLKDILYIYRDKDERKLVIKTTHNSFMINKSLESILPELDKRFKQVHRSCIANIERVSKYDWKNGKFTLDNNEEVEFLSKKYKDEIL